LQNPPQQGKPVTIADEIVVTATRFEDGYVDTPVNITVISAEDIKNSARFRELETVVLEKIREQVRGGNLRITT
jgi:outer membrane cobalamin receptor